EVPALGRGRGGGWAEYAGRRGDLALGGAAVTVGVGRDGHGGEAAVALVSAGPAPVRASSAEQQLRGSTLDDSSIRAASVEAVKGLRPTSDLHGSTEYRIGLLRTMTERALTKAAQRARSST